MRELIHTFGDKKNLHGIATLPEVNRFNVCIILLNAGVLHKVGPFDLNKDFARYLSALGYTLFRFDFAGMGDSIKIKSSMSHHQAVVKDMQAALDFMQRQYKFHLFVTIGLCTGAENGYKIAVEDDRVAGSVWLDGYGYASLKGTWMRYKWRILDISRILSFLKRRLNGQEDSLTHTVDDEEYDWVLPPKNELCKQLNRLHERGFKILNIYSGGVASYNSYRDQFKDTFKGQPFLESMEIEYYERADHTYKIRKDKGIMMKRVANWLSRNF